ncbi:RNA polymerase I specific transcription initiation factor RRN3 [Nitzschia inconspicua]|uniref:RNA polymerase I specific transcription initiation factor RRN3 n=1 Tax=Nitzschia inconspicua TaxID=303405 RepID=A0A9K3KPN4_9STRA|nr:RNA polymerase I specific transcription initiation factor RRN3 [Nitzschia inconspicua]
MTAAVSSSEMEANSVVSDLTMSQPSWKSNSWDYSPDTTAAMETVNEGGDEENPVATVTPRAKEPRGRASSGESDLVVSYEIPRCEVPPQSEMDPIEKFVVNAIKSQEPTLTVESDSESIVPPDPSHVQGYQAVINSFKRPNDPRLLLKLMIALRTAGNGSVLNQLALGNTHAQLVHLIIRFNPTRPPHNYQDIFVGDHEEMLKLYKDFSICDAHFHLLLAMVSAKSTHVLPILSATWKVLTKHGPIDDERLSHRLHSMIFNVLRLVPKSTSDLFPIMSTGFPFYSWNKEFLVWYVKQCFQVLEYLPSIRQRLLELIIDKCLEIDVNIFIKDNGDAIIDEEELAAAKEQKCHVNDDDDTMKVPGKTETEDQIDELSDKLDALLELLFGHIHGCQKDSAAVHEIFQELLPIFESSILTTHKSKFVQYCMFLICGMASESASSDPDSESILYREFASKLLEIVVDPYRATSTRQSGACYLASFISRASFVSAETVCESISALLSWAEAYIESLGNDAIRASDARTQSEFHSLFYTVCQASFYIMCFRGQEAIQYYRSAVSTRCSEEMSVDDEHSFSPCAEVDCINLSNERWTALCGHPLQPLRFCLESVRSEFLHVAHFFELIEGNTLDKLVADAKRLSTGRVNKKAASVISTAATLERRRQTGGVGGLGRGSNPLKSFFPFDPLLLRQSHEYIEPFYRFWQGPVEDEDVLVIDDGDGHSIEEPAFEMDDTLDALEDAAERQDEMEGNDSVDDEQSGHSEDDDGSDDDEQSVTEHTDNDDDENDGEDPIYGTPEPSQHKLLQQKAWTETLKRPRSYSMENGSW